MQNHLQKANYVFIHHFIINCSVLLLKIHRLEFFLNRLGMEYLCIDVFVL